jgi:chemotaxis protein methyltransferase CheR
MLIEDDDIETLLDEVYEKHGYDFTNYSFASVKRRVNRLFSLDKIPGFTEFRYRVLHDSIYFKRFVEELTVNVTEMFRDPHFYKVLRTEVLPTLAAKPFIRIWHAGCSTGEEVVSMAILLSEAGLLHKSIQYGTDLNPEVLEKARTGLFSLSNMKLYSENYIASGGTRDFSNYYIANYGQAKFKKELYEKIVFSTHNLVSDNSFNEFDLIFCRNVLIYFDKELQERALKLFDESLAPLGYLALGSKETLKFTELKVKYKQLDKEKIWLKTR